MGGERSGRKSSTAQRFHRRGRDHTKLRGWEATLFLAIHRDHSESRLWATALSDGLRVIYSSRSRAHVQSEVDWVRATGNGYLGDFSNLCVAFDLDPNDVRRDVLGDVREGRIRAKGIVC